MYYNIFDSKGETMKRKLISVRLADGTIIKISNKAKKCKVSFSEMLRNALENIFGR